VGGRTQWSVGGLPVVGTREVRAPVGIVEHEPAELIVRVAAGTAVTELDAALAVHRQCAALPLRPSATVGGVLAVGHSSVKRLGHGPLRDTVLEARFVNADGRVVKAGGPVVKNVSGFDLCRLLVGSLGTLGLLGEVVLRCRPRPQSSVWLLADEIDPTAVLRTLYRPAAVLWDGASTWLCLEGAKADVKEQWARASRHATWREVADPPEPPSTWHRQSMRPSAVRGLRGPFLAEVGVGVVHTPDPPSAPSLTDPSDAVQRRVKELFDPTGRLNPGRRVS
jgi:glycolate oxidase FAD binding subunit